MSNALPRKPRVLGSRLRVFIVASKYNEQFSDALVDNTVSELGKLMAHARIDLVRVPGAFEIPATVSTILSRFQPAVIICLGVIIKGATAHADLVATSVVDSLQSLAVEYRTPIINEVLLVSDEKQAYARCIGANLNRGVEAARAAATIVDVYSELKRTLPVEKTTA